MESPAKRVALKWNKASSSSAMENLPSCILMEILCRLPIKTLVTCKRICKSWLHLIRDPGFNKLHQAKAPVEVCFFREHSPEYTNLYMGNFNLLNTPPFPDTKINTLFRFKQFKVCPNNALNFDIESMTLSFANSCNGLLCFGSIDCNFGVIWNPITTEVATFPAPKRRVYWSTDCAYGLGFSRKDNRFKLLRVLDQKKRKSSEREVVAEICTIEKGCTWKELGPVPSFAWDLNFSTSALRRSTFLQGALHWIRVDWDSSEITIVSFDVESDQFGSVPLPPQLQVQTRNEGFNEIGEIGVLAGCLFITENTTKRVNVWLMKEYGVQDSWTKVISLGFPHKRSWDSSIVPITDLDNGEILLACKERFGNGNNRTDMVFCNPTLKSSRGLSCWTDFLKVIAVKPSLVPLKDSMMGYPVHVKLKPRYRVLEEFDGLDTTRLWMTSTDLSVKYFAYPRREHRSGALGMNDEVCVTAKGEERKGCVRPASKLSVPETSAAVLERQQRARALKTGTGGEHRGHINETGLVQAPASAISAPKTSKVEFKTPPANVETCEPFAREASHGHNNEMRSSVQNPTFVSSVPGISAPELPLQGRSEAPPANPGFIRTVMTSLPRTQATTDDPLERINALMGEVQEELRKEQQQ